MTASQEALPPLTQERPAGGWLWAALLSFFISLAIVSPFFWMGNATGHDFQYHAASWLDAAAQWKAGIIFPRWTEWANYGFGEPRFIFYPPLSWILGAAIGSTGLWNQAPVIFIVLVQTFAGVNAFALARRLVTKRAAFFCAACYVTSPYALLIVYLRSDFAELLADAFFPLLFLLLLELCELLGSPPPSGSRDPRRTIAVFAAVFAVIWLSNAPAGVIASYSAAALFAFAALLRKSWLPLLRGAAGLALGLGLCAFYLLPAAHEQRWVNIAQALSPGLLPSENFLYTAINDPEHTFFNWIVSSLAVLMVTLTGAAALAARRKNPLDESAVESAPWQALMLATGLATILMLRFTSIFWQLLPKLRFVQFPWRWMSLLAVPYAVFLAGAMVRKRWGGLCAVGVFVLLAASGVALVETGWWDTEDIPVLREAIAKGQGFEGTDEYDPAGDDHSNILTTSPEVRVMDTDTMQGPRIKPLVRVERWAPEEKDVSVQAPQPFFLGLRLLNYPAWRVELNGAMVTPRGGEDYNEMIVAMPAGDSHVQVRFIRTWDRATGGYISLAGVLVAGGLMIRRKTPNSDQA